MRRRRTPSRATPQKVVRCAIYTRKSTDEGLDQDFNSLDAQRESAENYIASQKAEGWECLPDRYDDGGFTGGNMERPALRRLLADIDAGLIDCVVVYKVDRLSRSLMDFARMMETFERHKVSFVSVTQQFNTTHSMGRLTLNILLSFAQFEREIISERTRDKIAAARRKGKWGGGRPLLGYDLVPLPGGSRLVVNEEEATRVRQIFDLYLEHEALIPVVKVLDERGWRSKQWTTKSGKPIGGRPFDKNSLFKLLTNPAYLGKVKHLTELFDGEHAAIVDEQTWTKVQQILKRNGSNGGVQVRNRHGALLKGLLRCVPCDCAMVHSVTAKGPKRYRYYVCATAMKRGWHTCPSKSIPAAEIERFVVDQIRKAASDPAILAATVRQVRVQSEKAIGKLEQERERLERELKRRGDALRELLAEPDVATASADVLRTREEIKALEQRRTEVRDRIIAIGRELVDEKQVVDALKVFDPVWDQLTTREKVRVIQLLVERVDCDGAQGTVAVTFQAEGMRALFDGKTEDAA